MSELYLSIPESSQIHTLAKYIHSDTISLEIFDEVLKFII